METGELERLMQEMADTKTTIQQLSHTMASLEARAPLAGRSMPPTHPEVTSAVLSSSFAALPAHLTVDPRAVDKPSHFHGDQ